MRDLLTLTSELVAIPSLSGEEAVLADHLEAELRAIEGLSVERIGDNLVARTTGDRPRRILLGGHLDTVDLATGSGARLDGEVCAGLGAADMKGGIAILLALAELAESEVDVERTFVFYCCEEVARARSGLLAVEAVRPELLAADVAILLEPTGGFVEAGCQGVVRARVNLVGRSAHSARPWTGVNTIHRLAPLLELVARFEERRPILDGCEYRESLQVVRIDGGRGGNVVPDSASALLSLRFAPDRDADGASAALVALIEPVIDRGGGDSVLVEEVAPAAPPALTTPLLAELVRLSDRRPRAKLAWTDVAFFAERGVPAANFGPGDPELAHTLDEEISRSDLDRSYEVLAELL